MQALTISECSHPLYSDEPELCSMHGLEMDGEYCPECEAGVIAEDERLRQELYTQDHSQEEA